VYYSLALRVKLKRRGVRLFTKCPMFNRAGEDGGHLLLNLEEIKVQLADMTSIKWLNAFRVQV
jgi:hypothetical protein